MHLLQGEFASAFPLFEQAYAVTADPARQWLIASVAHLAERRRGDFLPDGFSLFFPETRHRWGDYAPASLWRDRWEALKERVDSSYLEFAATWIFKELAMLPTDRTLTVGLSNTANPDNKLAAQIDSTIRDLFNVARDLKLIGFLGPMLAIRTELIVLNDATKQAQGLAMLANLIATGQQNNVLPQVGWLQLCRGDLLIMSAGSGHPFVFGYRLKDPGADQTALDYELFDRAKGDRTTPRAAYNEALHCFIAAGLPRGEAMARMRLAYLNALDQDWEAAQQEYTLALRQFEFAGDMLFAQAAQACGLWVRLQLAKPGLDAEAHNLGRTAYLNDAWAWGLSWGLAFAFAGREALLMGGDVETALRGATLAEAIFLELDAPVRCAQVCGDRANALQTLEATDAVTVELEAALNWIERAPRQGADDEDLRSKSIGVQVALSLVKSYAASFDPEGLVRTQVRARALVADVPLVSMKDIEAMFDPLRVGLQAVIGTLDLSQMHQKIRYFSIQEALRLIEELVAVQAPLSRGDRAMGAGKEEEAAEYFQAALRAASALEDRDMWRAMAYTMWRRYPEARVTLLQYIAAGMPQTTGALSSVRGNLGLLVNRQGVNDLEQKESLQHLQRNVTLFTRMNAWEDARRQLVEIAQRVGPPQPLGTLPTRDAINSRFDEGLLAEGLGDLERARDYFAEAAEGLEKHRRYLQTETLRRAMGGQVTTQMIYVGWAHALADAGNWEEAFLVSERARARLLAEALGAAQALRSALHSDATCRGYQEQTARVERLTSQLAQARTRAASASPQQADQRTRLTQAVAAIEAERAGAIAELNAREAALFQAYPRWRDLVAPQSELLSLPQVAQRLPAGTLLLAYLFAGERLLAWAITQDGLVGQHSLTRFNGQPFLARPFAARIQQWVRQLAAGAQEEGAPQPDPLGLALAESLLVPFDDLIEGAGRLLLVPYGELNLLPFAALPWHGQPLGLQKPLTSLPAASLLRSLRPADQGAAGALVVGNPEGMRRHDATGAASQRLAPLPAALAEAQAVAQLYGVQPLTGAQATKTAVLAALAGGPRVIHLATHGSLQPGVPLAAEIALAHGESLSADEVTGLRLVADLVVVSACDTGRGTLQGSELVGLARSLLSAGARTVVVSLWPVDDVATARLMAALHRRLRAGEADGALALQGAQTWLQGATARELDLAQYWQGVYRASGQSDGEALRRWRHYRAQPEVRPFAHPCFWAAFSYLGP